jgi:hypothetical protein
MNMLLIYLFASMRLEKGHKNYLALVLKLCYTMVFYEIGWNIIRNGGLNKKTKYSKTCLKWNAIVPVFFPFSQVSVLQRVVF